MSGSSDREHQERNQKKGPGYQERRFQGYERAISHYTLQPVMEGIVRTQRTAQPEEGKEDEKREIVAEVFGQKKLLSAQRFHYLQRQKSLAE
ncbi:hypothetical protein LR013_05015 [candidate division NPL-UPA2 bacterium]|nr:hypothetical protein [candidate division NPL-UPA2 bacterium]